MDCYTTDGEAKHISSNAVCSTAHAFNAGDVATVSEGSGVGVRRITEYMERHYAQDLSIGQLASQFGYSREHFSRLFKTRHRSYARPISDGNPVAIALDDLLNTGDTVAQIAQHNGFPNVRSFTTAFAARFSATPAVYRRAHNA